MRLASLLVLALVSASCGGTTATTTTDAGSSNTATESIGPEDGPDANPQPEVETESTSDQRANEDTDDGEAVATDIPDLEFINVSSGELVNLRSFVPSETALLFWFWAPH